MTVAPPSISVMVGWRRPSIWSGSRIPSWSIGSSSPWIVWISSRKATVSGSSSRRGRGSVMWYLLFAASVGRAGLHGRHRSRAAGHDRATARASGSVLADVERALKRLADEVVPLRKASEVLATKVGKLDPVGQPGKSGGHGDLPGPGRADGSDAAAAISCIVMTRLTLIDLEPPVEKVFLVAVDTGGEDGWSAQDSLAELSSLALTAGADVVGAEWQNRRHIDPNWYVGKGKAEDLLAAKRETGFGTLIADDELSPAQQRSLEELLNVKVIDRSRLILDIFALHAQTHEGRLQVELAQLEYQLPRLTRLWTHLSRTQGGIGSRGPGESQLETDRRIIRTRIAKMKERVEQVRQQRETAARGRDRRLWPTVGIVGYTNAGKSTLLNALVGSDVAHAEDKLFATLDPTSRQVKLGDGQTAIVTDTVGFIHKLPHQLVDAFRATLEEVNRADVLVEVVDASDGHFEEHRATVQTVLDELGAGEKPRLLAFNKADLLDAAARDEATPAPAIAGAVFVSALTGYGMETLRAEIAALLASLWVDVDVCLPYAAGELLARVRERGTIELEYGEREVRVFGRVSPPLAGELEAVAARWAAATMEDAAATEALEIATTPER